MKIIKSRIFKVLILLFILGLLFGVISFIFIDKTSLKNYTLNYIDLISENNFNYIKGLINTLISNYKYLSILWIFGIIFFLFPLVPLIIIYRGISIGLMISSIIYSFKLKGFLYALIILFPSKIINELIYIIMSYYSISFSLKIYNAIKTNKSINITSFSKNYFNILLIFIIALTLTSIFEVYLSTNIIKLII
jgi:stage II sporulation protein M